MRTHELPVLYLLGYIACTRFARPPRSGSGEQLVLLLAGGDKSSQERDITLARSMIEILENDP